MRIAPIVSALLLVACAGSPPLQTQYLLRGGHAERTGRVEAPVHIALGSVTIAPYLDQSGIVVEVEAGQVSAARQHQWAEPLDVALRSYLRAELSAALGYDVSASRADRPRWDYTVDVHVDRLHGTMAGTALLDAGYRITGGAEPVEYRFARSAPLPREGYAGVVEAEAGLARELAGAIAASIRELGGP
jgi:uncharacterized lipoprotein YmbA